MGTFGQPGEGGSQSQAFLCFQGGAPCRAYCGHQGRYEDEIDAKQAKGLRRATLTLYPWDGLQSWAQDLGLDGHGPCASYVKMLLAVAPGPPPLTVPTLLSLKTCSKCWIPRSGRTVGSPLPPRKAVPQSFVREFKFEGRNIPWKKPPHNGCRCGPRWLTAVSPGPTLGCARGEGAPRAVPALDSARKTSVSAHPRLAAAARPPFPSSRRTEAISSPAFPPRPAQWFPLRSTPATEMVSPCCLPPHNPRTRAGDAPVCGYQRPLPGPTKIRDSGRCPFILEPASPLPSWRQSPRPPSSPTLPPSRGWRRPPSRGRRTGSPRR